MKRATQIIAFAALLLAATSARADLIGSEMLIEVVHSGFESDAASGIHTYGRTESFYTPLDFELIVSSPGDAPGFDNSIDLDFADFTYGVLFSDSIGQITVSQIAENVAFDSVAVFVSGNDITASAATHVDSFTATWTVNEVMNVHTDGPVLTIAWNSVPAPGSIALLGLAGLISRRRRRRR